MTSVKKKQLKNKNLKIVIRLHGSDLYENIKSNYAPLRESIFSAVDLIVPISENGKNYLNQKFIKFDLFNMSLFFLKKNNFIY